MGAYVHLYLGEVDDTPSDRVRGFLLSILGPLRQEFARRLKVLRKQYPGHKLPCETCAFRSGTDNHSGFEKTILSFVAALAKGEPFLCHHNMPRDRSGQWRVPRKRKTGEINWRKVEYCQAWLVLRSTVPEPFDIHTLVPEVVCEGLAQMSESLGQ